GSRYVVSAITWHQWHHTASRSSSTKRFSRRACSKTDSDQPTQLRDSLGASCAFCRSSWAFSPASSHSSPTSMQVYAEAGSSDQASAASNRIPPFFFGTISIQGTLRGVLPFTQG